MRELTLDEIEQVSGGSAISDFATEGGAIGSIIGAGISEDPTCPYSDWICFKTHDCYSHDYKCPWSGPNTQ